MAEWSNAAVLKTVEGHTSGGSNPSFSAKDQARFLKRNRAFRFSVIFTMQKSMVSILIPFKNTENFLEECLQSILEQTYVDWEILAVDDHSIDNSRLIVEKYAKADSRIHVLSNKGSGIISALQTAYERSTGTLITRMDSDDLMTPIRLQTMVNSLQNHGKGHLAVGQVHYFSHRGMNNGYANYGKWLNQLTEKGKNYAEIYKECVIPSPCWMTHREDLNNCDAFNPQRYPEDYDLTFRFYEQGLKCIPCSEVLHHWRDYDSRTSRTSEHYAQNYFLDLKLSYFLKLDYNDQRPLNVWGAGNKGKTIAKMLLERQIEFNWLCDNYKKIGKLIYGKEMLHFSKLKEIENPQSIITVANKKAQVDIELYLKGFGYIAMRDYFFFC